mmetsp:Transcript_10294/g.24538  ORF Transcript_10294/g.24538 Transcript_10294/m.24538 type:complete len:404 (-) Transcript_10294:246-1457(-)|eukprot:CAMPEP_0172397882 /NCGR_PEP_ID=MMETSP1061-20121228/33398_1 /TAXON_ID=37318 /ORGANISM="Pseudo-nitzschia pungens, Strain cf. pungens" /LENGTH=403 /DNA_ID=CAMNT_0013130213 /DNA_START=235 /DNA_END=1446 /DNA_ORIENTATION=-
MEKDTFDMEGSDDIPTSPNPDAAPPADDELKAGMKPKKPTRHHRAHDSFYDIDGHLHGRGVESYKDEDEDIDDEEDIATEFRNSKWYIVSAVIFVFSSIMYVALGSMIMDTYWFYKDVPRHVYFADDDVSWWNYFVNCTDDGYIPENVTMADDDYSWMNWYNESAFFEDDVVWRPRIANPNTEYLEGSVTKYMMVYFVAASGFLITGAIEVVLARNAKLFYRMLYYLMILAAAFGVVSAILTNKNPLWSNITNCISCNLWALEGIVIVYQRIQGTSDADDYEEYARILGISVTSWFYLADFSFMIGTVGDAVASYFYIFEYDNWMMGISAVVFACFWLICSIVYLIVAIHDHNEYKKYINILDRFKKLRGMGGGEEESPLVAEAHVVEELDAGKSAKDAATPA